LNRRPADYKSAALPLSYVGFSFLAKLLSHLVTFIKLSGEPTAFESEGLDLETKQIRSQDPPFLLSGVERRRCEAPRPKGCGFPVRCFLYIVPLDPTFPRKAGRGTCRPDEQKTKAYLGETRRITAVHAKRSAKKKINCRTSLDSIGSSSHRKDLNHRRISTSCINIKENEGKTVTSWGRSRNQNTLIPNRLRRRPWV
jgi:hypothetical protein